MESLLKDERERGAVLSEKLQTAEVELSERLETIEALKTEMARHKDVTEKSKCKAPSSTRKRHKFMHDTQNSRFYSKE